MDDGHHPGMGDGDVDLERYLHAQDRPGPGSYAEALKEMQNGEKCSCWIWYIFPQFLDPARADSRNNQLYQLHNRQEAIAFLREETLGPRLTEIAAAVVKALELRSPNQLMGGGVDAKKLHQSITVFHLAAEQAGDMEETATLLHDLLKRMHGPNSRSFTQFAHFHDPEMKSQW